MSQNASVTKAPRQRRLYKFWLNLADSMEYNVAEICEYAKSRREYAKIIRDGIRLVWDLRQGQTTVLAELFPWVLNQPQPQQQGRAASEQFVTMLREVAQPERPQPVAVENKQSTSETFLDQLLGL